MAFAAWWIREWVRGFDESVQVLDPAKSVWDFGQQLFTEQGEDRRSRADAALFFYHGNSRHSLRGSRLVGTLLIGDDAPYRNIIQSLVDTQTAHIFQNKVRTWFQTSKGDSKLQFQAMGMSRAVEAGFADADLYGTKGFLICQDGQLHEAGVVKLTVDFANNRVLADRVFPWEVFVPDEEARAGNPRNFFHRQVVDRQVLIAMFPDHLDLIKAAPPCPDDWKFNYGSALSQTSDLVAIWEAWHLPSSNVDLRDAKVFGINPETKELDATLDPGHDGRHVIALENGALLDRPWPFDYPPLAFYRPQPDPVGFWSRSIPEALAAAQLELIKLGKRIQNLIHFLAIPRFFVWRNAKINKNQLATNDYLQLIDTSMPPSSSVYQATYPSVPAELFRREAEIVEWCQQQVGHTDFTMYGAKPPGVDHEPGMQLLLDETSIRHTPQYRAWEEFHLQLARAFVDGYRQLAEVNPDFALIWGDSKDLKQIKWKDVDIERSKYHLRIWPTNLLPSTPTAKANRVSQYVRDGLLSPATALSLLEYPDLEAAIGDSAAMRENIERKLLSIVEDGLNENNMPNAYMDLALAKALARERINRLEADGEDPSRSNDVRKFWDIAHSQELKMINEAAAAQRGELPPNPNPPGGGEPLPAPIPVPEAA